MELHRAQNFKNAVVSHLPGLFRKTSDMDWEHRRKVVVHVLDDDVRQIQFKVDGKIADAFVNSVVCFVGFRYGEGFRPVDPLKARELMAQYPDEFRLHTKQERPESFEANKARADGRQTPQRAAERPLRSEARRQHTPSPPLIQEVRHPPA